MKVSQNAIVVPMRGSQGCTHAWIGMVSVVGSHVSTSSCSRGRIIWSRMLSITQEGRRGIQHSRRSITGLQIRGDHEEIVERNLGIQQSHTRRSYGSMLVVGRMEERKGDEREEGKKKERNKHIFFPPISSLDPSSSHPSSPSPSSSSPSPIPLSSLVSGGHSVSVFSLPQQSSPC